MERPRISVIVPSVSGPHAIVDCLTSLAAQRTSTKYEILVVDRVGDSVRDVVSARFPSVILCATASGTAIPGLRFEGFKSASGDIICFVSDRCVVPEGWIENVLAAHGDGADAVGGTMNIEIPARLGSLMYFLLEYADFMPPEVRREVDGIAGTNASYKRSALGAVDRERLRSMWPIFVHREMRTAGCRFVLDPALELRYGSKYRPMQVMKLRYHFSRALAGIERARYPTPMSWLRGLASPLVIPLLYVRVLRRVFGKRRFVGAFVLGTPFMLLYLCSYATGEGMGYLFGPGDSDRRVA